jgi:tRNA(Arg) A34 adenosine deaminase TadA
MIKPPPWLNLSQIKKQTLASKQDKMELVLSLAKQNSHHKTGGPFAAAIFERKTNELISIGVNQVTSQNQSTLHAEIIAIMLAQEKLQTYDLSEKGHFELIASTEPCLMCLGAIIWSGLSKLVCGATDQDAEEIGFDEGPKPTNWVQELEKRDIEVLQNICQPKAKEVLTLYKENQGEIY